MLPCVDTGEEKVDPLRDERVAQFLKKNKAWGIAVFDGHLTKRYHRIREGIPLAISSDRQFLIADYYTWKVFDSNGNYNMGVRTQSKTTSYIYDVAISDVDDTIYLLVAQLMSPRISSPEKFEVQVFNETLDFQLRFPVVKGSGFNRLTVSCNKVFILKEHKVVYLYHERNSSYVCSFGEGIIESAPEITASLKMVGAPNVNFRKISVRKTI